MTDKVHCILCGQVILENVPRSEFSEGTFCADGAGCRRRALSRMKAAERKIEQLEADVSK